ncbi:MAG TPA: hypothetical protein VJ998_03400, partial [Pseudomonadales bacterium]|nr:hypothetical protein [Pseudomonadales bacterium]
KMATLFSGKQVVLKRTASKEEAIKYGTALKKVGADVKVKAMQVETPATPKQAAPTAQRAPATTADSGLSLAPNTGNLVEPAPPKPAPQIDLSGIELAENDDSPLAAPKPHEVIEIDLSEYSVSEMDDTPLATPAPSAPRMEAPDFGLDEPGAVLETLKEEKEEVHPDISSLSLAEVGTDLIKESEKPAAPPPKAPDTSSIHLVPNFDP